MIRSLQTLIFRGPPILEDCFTFAGSFSRRYSVEHDIPACPQISFALIEAFFLKEKKTELSSYHYGPPTGFAHRSNGLYHNYSLQSCADICGIVTAVNAAVAALDKPLLKCQVPVHQSGGNRSSSSILPITRCT